MSQPQLRGSGQPGGYLRAPEPPSWRPGAPSAESPPVKQKRRMKPPKRQKSPKLPLSERLPEGVYDSRPRYKRFVLHWLYFWTYARLGLYRLKFAPRPIVSLREQFDRNDRVIFDLASRKRACGATANSKGGAGKTPTATNLIATLDEHGKKSTLLIEANENAGNAAAMLGVDRDETLTLRAYLASLEAFGNHDALDSALGHHRHTSVAVIASDPNSNRSITGKRYVEGAINATRCYRAVMQDLGNGLANQSNLGAMRVATVPFVVACAAKPTSFSDADSTFVAYRDGHKLNDKMVNKTIVVFLGIKRRELPKLMEQYGFSFALEQIMTISYDRHMAKENPVDLAKLRLRTRVELQRIVIRWLEQSPDKTDPVLRSVEEVFEEYSDDTEFDGESKNEPGLTEAR